VVLQPSKAYQKWEELARLYIVQQVGPGFQLLTGKIFIEAQFYYKGNRPDLHGCFESLADCLEGFIYKDDGQIEVWGQKSRLYHDKVNPRTEILIQEI